jgi:hypothetical protein
VLCFLLKEVWTHVWFLGTGKHLQLLLDTFAVKYFTEAKMK